MRGLIGAIVVLLVAFPSVAAGQLPSGSTPLTGSNFQGGDGNQDDEGSYVDWQGLQANRSVVHTPDPNAEDSAFKGGSSLLEPQDWRLTTESEGVNPGKDNIFDAFGSVQQAGNETFLYLAFTREDGTGTAALSFELNRDGRFWNNGHAKIPCRTTGDLLITTEPHGNRVTISLYQWTTKTADAATGCAKTGTLKRYTTIPPGMGQGAANAAPIMSRLPGFFAAGSQIPTYDFSEVSLNLSALMKQAFGDGCLAYTSIWMHSRSSNSEDSNLQDYLAPEPLNIHTCAASGTKFYDTNGNGARDTGEPGLERFLVWADYDDDGVRDSNEPFSVTDDDGHYLIDDIRPPSGSYRLRETLVSSAARRAAATGWRCTFPNAGTGGGFANGTGGLFGCGWGPITVASTPFAQGRDFGNWVPAHLTVEKQLWPANDPGRFDLIVNGVTVIAAAGDGAHVTLELPAGTYNVSEQGAAGTNLADFDSDVNCRATTRRRGTHRSGTAWNGLVLAAGAQATCTFVNVRRGLAVPAIDLEKSGPTLAVAGDTLRYTLDVTNPGNVPIPAGEVKVTDDTCDAPPELSSKHGDTSENTLDHGDRWTYTCSHKTAEPGDDCVVTALTNVATASASVGGVDVSDEGRITTTLNCPDVPPEPPVPPDPGPDPSPEPSPGPEPLPPVTPAPEPPFEPPGGLVPDAGTGGIAGIIASSARCITRASELRLSGQRIGRYRVSVNGRLLATRTLRLLQRRSFPLTRIFAPGRYVLTIRVTFERGSGTAPVTLTRTVTICGRAARAPRVTG